MEKVQIIHDDNGPAFAVVPIAIWKRIEEGGDETAALIAAGNAARHDETFPAEIAERLVNGGVPLRVFREWRGLTQADLADKAGLAEQYISQIERRAGGRNLGRKSAEKLGAVLRVSVEALMDL